MPKPWRTFGERHGRLGYFRSETEFADKVFGLVEAVVHHGVLQKTSNSDARVTCRHWKQVYMETDSDLEMLAF